MSLSSQQLIKSLFIVLLAASVQLLPLAKADDEANTPAITDSSEQEQTSDSQTKGKISVELSVDKGNDADDSDDEVIIKVKRDGVELSDDEVEEELEEWEEEVIDALDNAFRGQPRKGIFALQQDRDSGFFEAGFGMATSNTKTMMREGFEGVEFVGEMNVGLQLSGLFFEYFSASPNRGLLGVNFYNNNWLGFDLIGGLEHHTFADDKEDTLLLPINVRHADWTAGLRSTIDLGPLVLQGQVRKEVTKYHNGYTGSLQLGTNVQLMNVNIHSVVGASYQSAEVVDYYYGVSAAEATETFAEYHPGEDLTYNAEVGISLPIDEDWVLRGQVNYTKYSDAIVNSPFWSSDEPEHISSRIMLLVVL